MTLKTTNREVLKIGGAILAAVVLALVGAYVLREFKTTPGLIVGVGLILLGVATALPIQLRGAVEVLHDSVPDVVGDLAGAITSHHPSMSATTTTATPDKPTVTPPADDRGDKGDKP